MLHGEYVELAGDLSSYELRVEKICYFLDPVVHYQVQGEDREHPLFGFATAPYPSDLELKERWKSMD